MIVAPAVCFGILAVFIVGCLITIGLLEIIYYIKGRRAPKGVNYWKEDDNEEGAVTVVLVGGCIAVALVGLIWCVYPEWSTNIWIALTGLGFLFGFLSFIFVPLLTNNSFPSTKIPPSQQRTHHWSAKTKAPPSQQGFYQSSANTKIPPVHEQSNRSHRSTTKPHTQDDPYRVLLAKARYDQNLADRLIEDEQKRLPNANLDTICRSIIDRLERDNR